MIMIEIVIDPFSFSPALVVAVNKQLLRLSWPLRLLDAPVVGPLRLYCHLLLLSLRSYQIYVLYPHHYRLSDP